MTVEGWLGPDIVDNCLCELKKFESCRGFEWWWGWWAGEGRVLVLYTGLDRIFANNKPRRKTRWLMTSLAEYVSQDSTHDVELNFKPDSHKHKKKYQEHRLGRHSSTEDREYKTVLAPVLVTRHELKAIPSLTRKFYIANSRINYHKPTNPTHHVWHRP